MAVINHKYKYIFFHVPHCAGRAIEESLIHHEGSKRCNGEHHITASGMLDKGFISQEQFSNYIRFRVIRNPYDWLVTCWMRNATGEPFFEWAVTKGLSFIKDGTLFDFKNDVTHTLHLDWDGGLSLEKGLHFIFHNLCGVTPMPLRKLGVTVNKPDPLDLLTCYQALQIERLYPDIRTYNYNIFNDTRVG